MAAGSIVWNLLMNTASFETDSKKAAKSLKGLKSEAAELTGVLKNMAGALGIATSFGALYSQIRETTDVMDEMAKTAKRVGTTTEEFSKLTYAAGLSDVSVEDLKNSMARLTQQAAQGNNAFAAMGISVKDSSGQLKDTGELMKEIAGRFASYADGANKTNLAIQLFGRSGAQLITLLNNGADGLKAAGDEAQRFGKVVSTDAGHAAEEFNDQVTRLGAQLSGGLQQAVVELLPTMKQIVDVFVSTGEQAAAASPLVDGLKFGLKAITSIALGVAQVFSTVGKVIGTFTAASIKGLTAWSRLDWSSGPVGLFKSIKREAASSLSAFEAGFSDINDDILATGEKISNLWDTPVKAVEAKSEDTAKKLAAPIVTATGTVKKQVDKMADAIKAMMAEGQRLAESLASPAEKKQSAQGTARRLQVVGAIDDTTYKRALAAAQSDYDAAIAQQQDTLHAGLLSEEQEINQSYERRRKQILALTEVTEQQRQTALQDLQDKHDKDLTDAQYNRYKDLMTSYETLTHDYIERKNDLYDDDTLTAEQRNQYLLKLAEDYHTATQKLDDEDQAKRESLSQQQIALVSTGFSNMADIAKTFAGTQSSVYQALFATSKAFAVADITIKQSQAIAKAWGENNYWTAIGLTVGLAAQFAGLLSSANSASFGGTRADGGDVSTGRSYLVGERGPERFTPSEPGTITSNADLQPRQTSQNVRIVNAYDSAHVADFMGSSAGEKIILNVAKRNKRAWGAS